MSPAPYVMLSVAISLSILLVLLHYIRYWGGGILTKSCWHAIWCSGGRFNSNDHEKGVVAVRTDPYSQLDYIKKSLL